MAQASSLNGSGGAVRGGQRLAAALLTYNGPRSNDAVGITFKQSIGVNDALRTGSLLQDADLHPVHDDSVKHQT